MDHSSYKSAKVEVQETHPSPMNLEEFLPWACSQLQFDFTLNIKRIEIHTYSSQSTNIKGRRSFKNKESDSEVESAVTGNMCLSNLYNPSDVDLSSIVFIYTVYDSNRNLIQLKFLNNLNVPNVLIKLIALAVPFHPYLTAIYINRGLKQSAVYELKKILNISKVTEVILDNTELVQANYYILLGANSRIKYLSLARCKINDVVVEKIASTLISSLPAGQNLCVLNLSSNRITDVGAKYLGSMLKVNRKLYYLNLCGNMINDIGAESILDSLKEFSLTPDDIQDMKREHLIYLKKNDAVVENVVNEMRVTDFDKKSIKKKSPKLTARSSKKCKILERNLQSSVSIMDKTSYDKAISTAELTLGPFTHPFTSDNTFIREGDVYCLGNNTLGYLNLSHNNLTYFTVKRIYQVVCKQQDLNRNPRGLMQIIIDGNFMPESCKELSEIDCILASDVVASKKVSIVFKKKQSSKTSK